MSDSQLPFPMSFLDKLRFPQLFVVLGLLFVVDLFFPDLLFGVDEIVLGILTLMLGRLRKPEGATTPVAPPPAKPPEKNVTPGGPPPPPAAGGQ